MCQADVLTLIKTFGPVSSLQLGKALGLNASTIAQSVKRLRDQGEIAPSGKQTIWRKMRLLGCGDLMRTVTKWKAILDAMKYEQPVPIRTITKKVGLTESSIRRHLNNMRELGLVEKEVNEHRAVGWRKTRSD